MAVFIVLNEPITTGDNLGSEQSSLIQFAYLQASGCLVTYQYALVIGHQANSRHPISKHLTIKADIYPEVS